MEVVEMYEVALDGEINGTGEIWGLYCYKCEDAVL
jgi:hypothetical protein